MGIKILIYGCDIGGANALGEVVDKFIKDYSPRRVQLLIFSKGLGYEAWKKKGFPAKKLPGESGIKKVIGWADMVFTATSYPADTEVMIWKAARKQRKPAVALLDFWTHYVERFTDPASGKLFWPDKILVMDEISKRGLIKYGAPPECIEITGQPFLEKRMKDFSSGRLSKKTAPKGLGIMFISQPLHKLPGAKKWGYDEFRALDCVTRALNSLTELDDLRPRLVIRPHPRENGRDLKNHMNFSDAKFKWGLDKESNPDRTISRCRFIFGMNSMLLIEAALGNKDVVSIQPGLVSEDPFPLSLMGYCRRIGSPGALREYIVEKMAEKNKKSTMTANMFVKNNLNSRERIIKVIFSYEKSRS